MLRQQNDKVKLRSCRFKKFKGATKCGYEGRRTKEVCFLCIVRGSHNRLQLILDHIGEFNINMARGWNLLTHVKSFREDVARLSEFVDRYYPQYREAMLKLLENNERLPYQI